MLGDDAGEALGAYDSVLELDAGIGLGFDACMRKLTSGFYVV